VIFFLYLVEREDAGLGDGSDFEETPAVGGLDRVSWAWFCGEHGFEGGGLGFEGFRGSGLGEFCLSGFEAGAFGGFFEGFGAAVVGEESGGESVDLGDPRFLGGEVGFHGLGVLVEGLGVGFLEFFEFFFLGLFLGFVGDFGEVFLDWGDGGGGRFWLGAEDEFHRAFFVGEDDSVWGGGGFAFFGSGFGFGFFSVVERLDFLVGDGLLGEFGFFGEGGEGGGFDVLTGVVVVDFCWGGSEGTADEFAEFLEEDDVVGEREELAFGGGFVTEVAAGEEGFVFGAVEAAVGFEGAEFLDHAGDVFAVGGDAEAFGLFAHDHDVVGEVEVVAGVAIGAGVAVGDGADGIDELLGWIGEASHVVVAFDHAAEAGCDCAHFVDGLFFACGEVATVDIADAGA